VKTICRLMMLALLVAPPFAHAADPMLRPRGPSGGERDVIVAEASPAARPSGGYVCSIEMIGGLPQRPFGGVQFSLTPGKDCAGEGETFVAWISSDDVAARSPGSDPAYSEAHVLALQQGLLTAAREGWRVFVEHDPDRAVIKKLTIRVK
jgi:hypothetical protein